MNTSQAAILGGVTVCAALTGWLLHTQDAYTGLTGSSEHGPDLFVNDMQLEVTDAAGTLQYRLQAGSLQHYPGTDQVELAGPVMEIFDRQQLLWHIRSERSTADDTGETVTLLGEVHIRRQETEEKQWLAVTTRDLSVSTGARTADTPHRAVITSERYTIEGVGMHADFIANRLELHSRVRGRFNVSG